MYMRDVILHLPLSSPPDAEMKDLFIIKLMQFCCALKNLKYIGIYNIIMPAGICNKVYVNRFI